MLRFEQLRIDSTQHRGGYFYGKAEAEITYTFHWSCMSVSIRCCEYRASRWEYNSMDFFSFIFLKR